MKKYRITALPKMQKGGVPNYKARFDITPAAQEDGTVIEPLGWDAGFIKDRMNEFLESLSDEEKENLSNTGDTDREFLKFLNQSVLSEEGGLAEPQHGFYFKPIYRTNSKGEKIIESFEPYSNYDINNLIINRGATAQEFENLGFGNKEDFKNSFGDIIKRAKAFYEQGNQETIAKELLEGKTVDEAIQTLVDKDMGSSEKLKNLFGEYAGDFQDELIEAMISSFKENSGLDPDEDLNEVIDAGKSFYDPQVVGKKSVTNPDAPITASKSAFLEYDDKTLKRKEKERQQEEIARKYDQDKDATNLQLLDTRNDEILNLRRPVDTYTEESREIQDAYNAPDPETEPQIEDYIGLNSSNPMFLGDDYDPFKEFKEAHDAWKNSTKLESDYTNAWVLKDLFKRIGIDSNEWKNKSSSEKASILKELQGQTGDINYVEKSKLSEDGKTLLRPKSNLEKYYDKSFDNFARLHDPLTFYKYSDLEDDQPSTLGILFNNLTGTKTFDEAPPIVKTRDYKKILRNPENYDADWNVKDPNRQMFEIGDIKDMGPIAYDGHVFEGFELPTEDLIGFNIPLMPTGIGNVPGLLAAGTQAAPNISTRVAAALKGAYKNPLTKTLGINRLANFTGASKYIPNVAKNINKLITPSNAAHLHYLANSPEYIEEGLTEDLPSLYDNLSQGNYKDAAMDAGMAAFNIGSIMPWYRMGKNLNNLRGGLSTVNAPFLKNYTVGFRSPSGNTGLQFNPQEGKDVKSIFSVPIGDRGALGIGKYRPRMGEGYNSNQLQLQQQGGITKGKSKIQGDGMFTTRPFREGEMIGLAHEDDQPATELGRMHNHDEANPTMISRKIGNQRYVFANRDLEAGEELTTNYRMQPELEQPEDFQKGGQIPKAQGGGALKTLRGIKEALPTIYSGFVPSPVMNPTELARFKDLNTLLSEYSFTGIPKNISGTLSIEDIEKFRDIQRNASRQKLKTILQNANVTKQDLITILGNPGYNKTLLKGQTDFDMAGNPIVTYGEDFDAAERARQEIERLSADELLDKVERAIVSTGERGLIKPSFETRFDRNASSALDNLERSNAFEVDSVGYPGMPTILQASGLAPEEQIYFDFANNTDFRNSVPVKEAIISLFANSHGTKQELFDDFGYKLNTGFWRAKPNTIVTGSLDTSDDSYLMQMSRMLRTASPRKASKYGVVPHPMFLGYHKPNEMSRLSGFLGNSQLGLSRDQQKNLRASYLQAMLEQAYDLQGIAPEERLPIIQATQRGSVPMTDRYTNSGDILIPHFGIMKLPVDWTGKRRPKLKKGGSIESELNQKEIDNLVKQGYIVEEV